MEALLHPTVHTETEQPLLRRWWMRWASPRTWSETLHCLLGLPVGIVTFTVMVTLWSVALSTVIIYVGVVLIWVTVAIASAMASFERARAHTLLGTRIAEPPPRVWQNGWWRKTWGVLREARTWRETLYHLVMLPWGVIVFSIAVAVWSAALGSLTIATWWWATDDSNITWAGSGLNNNWGVALITALGIPLTLLAPFIIRAMSVVSSALATALLGPSRRELESRAVVATRQRDQASDVANSDLRRIERDLHDGVQAQLVSLAMSLGQARDRIEHGDGDAATLVVEAHEQAKGVLAEVRALARGIMPPVLVDRGLGAALTSLAARCPIPVDLDLADDLGDEPRPAAAIEAAAYFVAAEGITNAAKHSGAHRVLVTARRFGERVELTVRDDGNGGAMVVPGGGLAGLAERVESVGGVLSVISDAQGTSIRAVMPRD
ncbi:MAG: sensor histidine kinase [Acidimicrobiia bacterium]